MGAIAGVQYFNESPNTGSDKLVEQMLATMQHRAPYHHVHQTSRASSFGIRYHQMTEKARVLAHDPDEKIFVILDGEIFNTTNDYSSDKAEFSDAELILQLYQRKGDEFLDEIDGSYSIAILDGKQNKSLLARDRLGYKPLFYLKLNDSLVFASEIKSILNFKHYGKSVNLRALNNFLSYGYVTNPETLFESVCQVRPGHLLVCKNGSTEEIPYWRLIYRQNEADIPEASYKRRFLEIFENSVSRRVKRHPDCGAFLSGGLDTSGVAAVLHKLTKKPFKVFTGGFQEERYNEVGDAKVVADHLGLDHRTVIIEFSDDFPELLEKIVWHHDAPFCDTSAIPSYFASGLAKEHVDVVLTGDFPDQLIGGSGHHVAALARQRDDSSIYRLLRNKALNHLVSKLPWSAGGTSLYDRMKRMIYRETFPLEEQRILLNMPVPELLKRRLYGPDMLEINSTNNPLSIARSIYHDVRQCSLLDKLLYFDSLSYAADDLMVKVERMTTAHGLIALSPFHDRELVEFIATVPTDLKIKGEVRKYIMKEALRPMLPEHTLKKPKKGFDMPIEEWLIKKFPDYVRELLFDPSTLNRGYFEKAFMRRMVEDFLEKKTDYASGSEATIISLITLEMWHRLFIDK
jgi:asparagine synthase (glutamine-hydrolysing)